MNWDEAEDFNLLDLKSFLMNQVGILGTKHDVDSSCYPPVNGESILKSVGGVKPEGSATAFNCGTPVIGNLPKQDCLKPMESFTACSFSFPRNQVGLSMNQGRQTGKVPSRFILLDSESTHCTFYTKDYLHDIRTSENPILVHTNGGKMMCTLEGFLPGFRWVYYNPAGIANILSLAVVESRGRRITYDSWAVMGRRNIPRP